MFTKKSEIIDLYDAATGTHFGYEVATGHAAWFRTKSDTERDRLVRYMKSERLRDVVKTMEV